MIDTNRAYVPPAKYQPKPHDPNKRPEKVKGFTVVSFFVLIGIYLAKYALDCWLMPNLFPQLYPVSVLAIVIWVVETIVISSLCIKFVSGFGYFYIPACLVYALAVLIAPNNIFCFGTVIPHIFAGLIAYSASRFIQKVVMWFFIGLAFMTM
jgi:hypothetical protein